jgi:hypothetical protein
MSWGIELFILAALLLLVWSRVPKRARPRKKFLKELHATKPIIPKHARPTNPRTGWCTDRDRLFFDEFADFGDVVNWWLSDEHTRRPWRLQERVDTEARHGFSDMPTLARRYDVFHNQALMGQLEVSASFPYEPNARKVHVSVKLMFCRLLSLEDVEGFLHDIELHVSDMGHHSIGSLEAQLAIQRALLKVVWKHQEISRWNDMPEGLGDLELDLFGPASWYFERRDAPAHRGSLAGAHRLS